MAGIAEINWGVSSKSCTGTMLRNGQVIDSFKTDATDRDSMAVRTVLTETSPTDVFQLCEEPVCSVSIVNFTSWKITPKPTVRPSPSPTLAYPTQELPGKDLLNYLIASVLSLFFSFPSFFPLATSFLTPLNLQPKMQRKFPQRNQA